MSIFRELSAKRAAHIRDLLRHKRVRDAENTFIIEGSKPITELLGKGDNRLRTIVVTQPFLEQCDPVLTQLLEASHQQVFTCQTILFDSIAHTTNPSGILGIVDKPKWNEREILSRERFLGLYGERVQDPTNVGTFIRTAAALGVDAVWLSTDSADIFNPKVVRGTVGTVLRLPIFYVTHPALFTQEGCSLYATEPSRQGTLSITNISEVAPKTIIAFGNESRGLSLQFLQRATTRFHIPVERGVESLNVAASAAIATFYFSELHKQRSDPKE